MKGELRLFKRIAIGCGGLIALFIFISVCTSIVGGNGNSHIDTASTPTATAPPTTAQPTAKPTTAPPPPTPAGPILHLEGSGSKSSDDFKVPSLWHFDWAYDCGNFGYNGNFIVTFQGNGGYLPGVNKLGMKDQGTEAYHSGGTYHLEINSVCAWSVTVKP